MLTRHETQTVALRHRRQDEIRLHRGEGVTNAHARPIAKRQVGALGQLLLELFGKPFGPESVRIVEPAGITVNDVWADVNDHALWHRVAAENNLFFRLPGNGG